MAVVCGCGLWLQPVAVVAAVAVNCVLWLWLQPVAMVVVVAFGCCCGLAGSLRCDLQLWLRLLPVTCGCGTGLLL